MIVTRLPKNIPCIALLMILVELNLETLAAVFRQEINVPLIFQPMSNEKIELGVTAIGDRVRLHDV